MIIVVIFLGKDLLSAGANITCNRNYLNIKDKILEDELVNNGSS